MTELSVPQSKKLAITDIKPYWRNPRRIPQAAVDAVAESIRRYGYQQPIVVDENDVIIVGHTRHQALIKLGYSEVEVYVSGLDEEGAKQYRLIDNRTSEMTSWDHDALVMELRQFEDGLLKEFFPEVDLEIGMITDATGVDDADIADAARKVTRVAEADPSSTQNTKVQCPACFHTFDVRTRSLPGLTYGDLERVRAASGE